MELFQVARKRLKLCTYFVSLDALYIYFISLDNFFLFSTLASSLHGRSGASAGVRVVLIWGRATNQGDLIHSPVYHVTPAVVPEVLPNALGGGEARRVGNASVYDTHV